MENWEKINESIVIRHIFLFFQIFKAQWLPGLFLITVMQRLSTIALNSMLMNLCLPCWKSQGKVLEFHFIWKLVTFR